MNNYTYPPISALISDRFAAHTYWGLSNQENNQLLKYYIELDEGEFEGFDGDTFNSLGHSDEDIAFIESIFLRLDPLLDIDFKRELDFSDTLLDIYSVDSHSEWDSDTVGMVEDHTSQSDLWWDAMWKDTDGRASLSDFDKNTIVHELGHSLGLSHPYEDPENPLFDTSDTIMSYNEGPDGWDTWFSDADIQALQALWGSEEDTAGGQKNNYSATELIEGTEDRDRLIGSNADDDIYGFNGDDKLIGKSGDDWIYPGEFGRRGDKIKTGSGEDIVFADQNGWFKILDFEQGADAIDISDIAGETFYSWAGNWTILEDKDGVEFGRLRGNIDLFIDGDILW